MQGFVNTTSISVERLGLVRKYTFCGQFRDLCIVLGLVWARNYTFYGQFRGLCIVLG